MMIKPSQQDSRTSETKESLIQKEAKTKKRYFRNTVLQLSKVWSLQESLSRAKKRKGTHEASIAEEKEPTKKTKQDGRDFFY